MRRLYKKEKELEAVLDSDEAPEPEKAEAIRELEQLYEFQRHHAGNRNKLDNLITKKSNDERHSPVLEFQIDTVAAHSVP